MPTTASMNAKQSSAITTIAPTKRSLAHWCESLQLDQLPVDQAIRHQAIIKLQSPAGNARNVAAIIERCPVLSLLLFCETNRRLRGADNHCQNLVHAIGLLGIPTVEGIINKAPIFNDEAISSEAKEGYYRALACSQLAADWVRQWSQLSRHWHAYGDLLTWATLFQRAPLWALWLENNNAMAAQEYQRAERCGASQPSITADDEPTSVIIAAVGKRWQLPELCEQSWQSTVVGSSRDWLSLRASVDDQQNAHFCHHPAFAVALANQLADQTSWCWSDHRATRLFNVLTASLNNQHATNLSHQQVASSSRHRALPFASELLCDYRRSKDLLDRRTAPVIIADNVKCEQPSDETLPAIEAIEKQQANTNGDANKIPLNTAVEQPAQQPLTPPPADTGNILSAANIDINPQQTLEPAKANPFQNALTRLSTQADSFDDQHQVFKYLLQTLNEQLKLTRCSTAIYNPANAELRTLYSLGVIDSPALKNYRHTLKGNDFFSMLLKKPTSFQLHAGNYQKFWPLLPNQFRQAIKTPQFFIMSLFVDNKPFALIYGDRAGQVNKLTESQYKHFKQLCIATGNCLNAVKNR